MSDQDTNMPEMDDLYSLGLDSQKANEAEAKMLPEGGTYYSTPPVTVTFTPSDDGRAIFRGYGVFTLKDSEKQARLGFGFSPDLRMQVNRRTGDSEYDRASKNYVALRRAYIRVFGEDPKTVADLKGYIEQYPVGVRLSKWVDDATGEPRTSIVNIFPVS